MIMLSGLLQVLKVDACDDVDVVNSKWLDTLTSVFISFNVLCMHVVLICIYAYIQ
jgi:hypothetical protein